MATFWNPTPPPVECSLALLAPLLAESPVALQERAGSVDLAQRARARRTPAGTPTAGGSASDAAAPRNGSAVPDTNRTNRRDRTGASHHRPPHPTSTAPQRTRMGGLGRRVGGVAPQSRVEASASQRSARFVDSRAAPARTAFESSRSGRAGVRPSHDRPRPAGG